MTATKIYCFFIALLASSGVLMSQPAHSAIIETESNNTLATADVIVRTTPVFADVGIASLGTGSDVDVFSISLLAGDYLLANTAGIAGNPPGSSPDTVMGLFDPAGNLLTADDDSYALGSNFTYLISTAGVYSIAITGFPDGLNGLIGDPFGGPGFFDGTDGIAAPHGETGRYILTVSVVPVPEPTSCLLLGVGSLLLCGARRRRAALAVESR